MLIENGVQDPKLILYDVPELQLGLWHVVGRETRSANRDMNTWEDHWAKFAPVLWMVDAVCPCFYLPPKNVFDASHRVVPMVAALRKYSLGRELWAVMWSRTVAPQYGFVESDWEESRNLNARLAEALSGSGVKHFLHWSQPDQLQGVIGPDKSVVEACIGATE